ncbi:NAD(P)H-hydrate epimerase [Cryptococcus wingfieldii CBS 7118]|uniref:NAD(P)H-hydrate epimerase n=1 Tax=Cryptococcus wingfieldii CBS 7118 TaxID=1295528 RepID=A0A1E3IAJ3_9TREE|nr:NAD(P)H-hydrate epimerase [Cryptococcus wingfieldii CBS 7118]ODN85663.1 NAD(P)H-hydrate epimerase [Cryptococcus wingfieldii CBS 7118]
MSIKYISQKLAQQIDEELMGPHGAFSIDQLMELAGLSCAQALAKSYPAKSHRRLMVACGPGNQGGDGLVAARHLHHFAYKPTVYLPKPSSKDLLQRLVTQCENLKIPIIKDVEGFQKALKESDVVLDAIFGFSFHPPLRKPFDQVLKAITSAKLPIVSVDIPSGWSVTDGPQPLYTQEDEDGKTETVETFEPEVLISLTAPKEGVKGFKGRHWLGGRFIPDELSEKYGLNLPEYDGVDQVVELPRA